MFNFNHKKIYEFRVRRELTQSELAKMIGVTDVTISRWENGLHIPNAQHLVLLADALWVYVEGFFD